MNRLRAVLLVALPVAALTAGITHAATATPRLEAVVAPLDLFTPTPPTRLLDTRTGYGADLPGRRHPGEVIPVVVPGGDTAVKAVAINLKLVDPDGGGWAVAWSGRTPIPNASNIDDNGTSPINGYAIAEVDPLCSCFRVYFSPQLSADLVVDLVGFYSRTPEYAVGPPPVP